MAYQRLYIAAAGDPFSLKIPKRLRKLKIGRSLGRLARGVTRSPFAGLIPGVGPYMMAAQRAGLMGDPFKLPNIGKLLGKAGGLLGSKGKALLPVLGSILTGGGLVGAAAGIGAGALAGKIFGGHGGKRHYRRMNVGNIKALNRSVRRVQGFADLAKKTIHMSSTIRMRRRGKKR